MIPAATNSLLNAVAAVLRGEVELVRDESHIGVTTYRFRAVR